MSNDLFRKQKSGHGPSGSVSESVSQSQSAVAGKQLKRCLATVTDSDRDCDPDSDPDTDSRSSTAVFMRHRVRRVKGCLEDRMTGEGKQVGAQCRLSPLQEFGSV